MFRTVRAAVFVGFGLIGGIWVFAGYYFTGRMAELEQRSDAINSRYTRAQDLLTTARGQILMGSVYVRDALLDPNPAEAADYRRQLEASYRSANEALKEYVPVFDSPSEQDRIARLRAEIEDFRKTLLDVLSTDSRRWPTEARDLLRQRIMPKREAVMRISDEVQALNRAAFVQQQTEIAALYRETQRRVWQTVGLALLASLAIAVLATGYAGRLETRVEQQRRKAVDTAHDLERLSSQLLTAQEEERRRIARELHDEVGQALTAIKVELAVAERAIHSRDGRSDALADVRSITDGAINTVRDLSHLLHPSMLDDLGLSSAVDWYLKGFGQRHGLKTELQQEGMTGRLTPEIEAGVFRIVQEALTNVAKHARAISCRVSLQRLPHSLFVTVEDDGLGFDPTASRRGPRGLGLVGIRERVTRLNGQMRIETAPGKGTRLSVEVPVDAGEREALAG